MILRFVVDIEVDLLSAQLKCVPLHDVKQCMKEDIKACIEVGVEGNEDILPGFKKVTSIFPE